MTDSQEKRGSGVAAPIAAVAAVAGVAVLVVAVFRLGNVLGDEAADAATTTTGTPPVATTSAPPVTASAAAVTRSDDSGTISVAVPAGWGDVSGSAWAVEGDPVGPAITAATDIEEWYSGWDTPGVFVGVATSGFRPDLGDFSGVCARGARRERSVGLLTGVVQAWSSCGGAGSDFLVFLGGPEGGSYVVLVQLVSTDGSGAAELERILTTFSYGN